MAKTLVYLPNPNGGPALPQLWHDHAFTVGGKPVEPIDSHVISADLECYSINQLIAWHPCRAPQSQPEPKVKL